MITFDKFVVSPYEPTSTQVLWIRRDPEKEGAEAKAFIDGKWRSVGTSDDLQNYLTTDAFQEYMESYYNKTQTDNKLFGKLDKPAVVGTDGQILSLNSQGKPTWINPAEGSVVDDSMSDVSTNPVQNKIIKEYIDNYTPALAENLAPWADQKAIATPDTYTDAVRTTGGDIPIETSAGSKLESIKPVAGSKWTAKMLFNGSYNMLNAAKYGDNTDPFIGGLSGQSCYFLVPKLTLGEFGTAEENNGLLFTLEDGTNINPTVYFKPLGSIPPESSTDGTLVTPTAVSYNGKTYYSYECNEEGWFILTYPSGKTANDICAHIAWEDWYDKYVNLTDSETDPEKIIGILMLEGLLALAHSDKYLRGINEETCDNVVFGDTSATVTHMVDEISVAANAWTNSATGESDSQGNALYRHSATVSGIKQGGAACVEGEDGGIPLTVNGTTVSYIDTNAAASASTVFYEVTATSTIKAYTDSVFNGSNINQETGVLPINDCSIEAQVAMEGMANITVKYAKNIVDQVAINAATDVPKLQEQVEKHEEQITELEDTAVRTGSYDASVAVGLADNFKGDTIVEAEFYKRKTGGTQSVGSGIAAIKEVKGKSIVWNQKVKYLSSTNYNNGSTGNASIVVSDGTLTFTSDGTYFSWASLKNIQKNNTIIHTHKYLLHYNVVETNLPNANMLVVSTTLNKSQVGILGMLSSTGVKNREITFRESSDGTIGGVGVSSTAGAALPAGSRCVIKDIMLFDLTLMFGAGNEPDTPEEFEKMFPLDYYDYNEGEVIPFAGQNLTTTGKNQYNPATGKANLLGGQQYQIGGTFTGATVDGVAVTLDSNNCFTTTKDCVLDVAGGNDTDTIVALYNGENVTFEPYVRHALPLDPSQWRDKDGNLVFLYGGMHGVGTSYDYAKVDADGYIRKAVRVFGAVDLGKLSWTYINSAFRATVVGAKNVPTWTVAANLTCAKYITIRHSVASYSAKYICMRDDGDGLIQVGDSAYSDAATFKAAMNGVMLVYELATPVEVELATPVYAKYLVDKDGTEEITPANGSTPYTTMANLSILYAMDARGEIKNLPKNYISAASMDKFLVKLGVVTNGTWSKTYNTQAQDYDFDFVPNPEPEENTQS